MEIVGSPGQRKHIDMIKVIKIINFTSSNFYLFSIFMEFKIGLKDFFYSFCYTLSDEVYSTARVYMWEENLGLEKSTT